MWNRTEVVHVTGGLNKKMWRNSEKSWGDVWKKWFLTTNIDGYFWLPFLRLQWFVYLLFLGWNFRSNTPCLWWYADKKRSQKFSKVLVDLNRISLDIEPPPQKNRTLWDHFLHLMTQNQRFFVSPKWGVTFVTFRYQLLELQTMQGLASLLYWSGRRMATLL